MVLAKLFKWPNIEQIISSNFGQNVYKINQTLGNF